ncbi:hypothetical protein JY651_32835 [Pyxidicoccus parkwayensis]|uniref:Cytochrome c domain-containing protein n=1 Tax=Pyxidicoccus parkwayensis TaxID=2813578 RepID=A0ABX7NRL2_9BACT|nr:hypothetical protein [Pyxidicoccus parkwaysis]QSQ20041.1 hypothetical protein JY651_32835 [Pyxidicoccus parkwaysis]
MKRALQLTAIALTALVLLATVALIVIEPGWAKSEQRAPKDTFLYGSVGVELMPLPVLQVMPDLFPERFQPAGAAAGDWIDQFGFVRGKPGVNEGLPIGLMVSNYRAKSGDPSPTRWVGFSCGLCHTAIIQTDEQDPGVVVVGMGNHSLDLFAWLEAVQGSLLDEERLTVDTISRAYEARFKKPLGAVERLMVKLSLDAARADLQSHLPGWDAPHEAAKLRVPRYLTNGPSRTQAFRELVRFFMNRPASEDRAHSKLPSIFLQRNRDWAQADGSVSDPTTRSVFAVLAAGATPENLVVPGIRGNLQQVVDLTLHLQGPRYADVFPKHPIDPAKAERGRNVYMRYCNDCHGAPGPDGTWQRGRLQGQVMSVEAIGTDPERVGFRYYEQLIPAVYDAIPDGHPFKPRRDTLRSTGGYVNAPLESVFTRVPYLHNGSVLTLAELINRVPRREVFYRGRNFYDPVAVGLKSPEQPDSRHYYLFDTRVRGNSNRGHAYPWAYQGPGWDPVALDDLLEYLKTL